MRPDPKLTLPYITQLIQHGNQSLHDNTVDRKHTKHMNRGQVSKKVTKRIVRNSYVMSDTFKADKIWR
jgi:hypothetical protein